MSVRPIPTPQTRTDEVLAAIADRLDAQNELLGQVLARLPEPATTVDDPAPATSTVELREPVKTTTPTNTGSPQRTRTRQRRTP